MYLLGFDVGSSSVKVALVSTDTGKVVARTQSPDVDMGISSPHPGWAEQDPELWWHHLRLASQELSQSHPHQMKQVQAIGISYQMHGLVVLDKNRKVLRPAIIWCDSRAVAIGDEAFDQLGHKNCLDHLLNSPGNFTASKLRWVQENEPAIYKQIHSFMLPGDFLAGKMTGVWSTTASGLSEGILWDFLDEQPANLLLGYYDIDHSLLPDLLPTFGNQGGVAPEVARELGVSPGTPVSYRAGDQPNNALSLNVLQPGQIAATGGTSGVVYGVGDQPISDPQGRINTFLHVNHTHSAPRMGALLCINGAGIQYSWIRNLSNGKGLSYKEMSTEAEQIPIGSEGLSVLPFGNGAERMFSNKIIGSHIQNLDLNRHSPAHLFRASLEGIAFSFVHGIRIMNSLGIEASHIKADSHNLFQSAVFSQTIANLTSSTIEIIDTNGAIGAAIGAGFGAGIYVSIEEGMQGLTTKAQYVPDISNEQYFHAYQNWVGQLSQHIAEPIVNH